MAKRVIILILSSLLLCGGLFLLAGELFPTLVDGPEQPGEGRKNGTQTIPSAVAALAEEITADVNDDYARLEAIYDWVTHNIQYDLEKLKDMRAYGAGAEYVLGTRKGVCHDYAYLTEALLIAVGIEATYESGEVYSSQGETELHAWNHALIDGSWYALDTTWGAGTILAGEERFVHSPRRLYLTNPEELQRLHGDPDYRREQEHEYSRARSADAPVKYLPDQGQELVTLFNEYRNSVGLSHLAIETRLAETARRDALRIVENSVNNHGYNPKILENEIQERARELRIESAYRVYAEYWSLYPVTVEKLYDMMAGNGQANYLDSASHQAVSVGVVSKGDCTVVVCIFLQRY